MSATKKQRPESEKWHLERFNPANVNPQLTEDLLARATSVLSAKFVNGWDACGRRVWLDATGKKTFRPVARTYNEQLAEAIHARLATNDPEGPEGDKAEKETLDRLKAIHGRLPLTIARVRDSVRGWDDLGFEAYYGGYSQETRDGITGGLEIAIDLDDEACAHHGQTPLQIAQRIVAEVAKVGLDPFVFANTSQSGRGLHLHILLGFFCPSWLRKRVGEALVERTGLPVGAGRKAGLIEVNPKGDAANLGNILGLPLNDWLMRSKGATCPINLTTGQLTSDIRAAIELAERAPQAPADLFHAAARMLGIDPERPPAAPVYEPRAAQIQTKTGQFVEIEALSPWRALELLVLSRIDLDDFLRSCGRPVGPDGKTTCVVHEPPLEAGGVQSFTTHAATSVGAKIGIPHLKHWHCWGDCNCKGNLIKLCQRLWLCSRNEATQRLAREWLKIDTAAFLRSEREKREAAIARFQLHAVAHPRLAHWIALAGQNCNTDVARTKFLQALSKALLPLGIEPNVLAFSAVDAFGASNMGRGEAFAILDDVKRRIEEQLACPGLPWLRRRVSTSGLRALAQVVLSLTKGTIVDVSRKVVGAARYVRGGAARKILREWFQPIPKRPKKPKPGDHRPPWERREDDEDQEHVGHMTATTPTGPEHPDTRIRPMLQWPAVCGDWNNEVWSGEGHKLGVTGVHCRMQYACVGCAMQHYGGVYDLLTADVKDNPQADLSWQGQADRFFGIWTWVPIKGAKPFLKEISACRADVAKLRVLGMDPDPARRGWIRVLLVAYDADNRDAAIEAVRMGLCMAQDAAPELERVDTWKWHAVTETTDVKVAAGWVFEQGMSLPYYATDCVERGDKAGMFEYLHWVKGQRFALATGKRRDGKKKLKIPSRAVVRAATKGQDSDLAMYEGQQLVHKLVWAPSGYVLGERDQPWTIGSAIALAGSSQAFQDHVAQFDERQRAQQGGVCVTV